MPQQLNNKQGDKHILKKMLRQENHQIERPEVKKRGLQFKVKTEMKERCNAKLPFSYQSTYRDYIKIISFDYCRNPNLAGCDVGLDVEHKRKKKSIAGPRLSTQGRDCHLLRWKRQENRV